MKGNSDYINTVKSFIVKNFLFGDSSNPENGSSFLENRLVDSTGIMGITSFLEKTYAIKIKDNELIPENLDSLDSINDFLKRKHL